LPILHIEHRVPDFDRWKESFDSDPVRREESGVRRYRILRGSDDPNLVMLDLEFDTTSDAEALLTALRELWREMEPAGVIDEAPHARIVETIETKEY
jgi:hypothetical protein